MAMRWLFGKRELAEGDVVLPPSLSRFPFV
jgi:hypothetical protein